MPTSIDELQIEINAKAVKANDAIDRLVGKLNGLTTSLGKLNTSNLNGLANGVQKLGSAMQVMNTVKTADFTRLAKNLSSMGNINTQGLNNTASSLSQITRAMNNIGAVSHNAVQLSEMAKNLSKFGGANVQRATVNIPLLANELRKLMMTLSSAPNVSRNIIDMTNALANLSTQGSKVGSASRSIQRSLNGTATSTARAKKGFNGLASAIGKFYASYFLVIRGIKGLWSSINTTADYIEAFNYYTVSFGKIASKWDENWENYGSENAQNYSNSFVTTMNDSFKKLSGVSYDPQTGLLSETGLKNLGLNLQEVTQYAAQLGSMMDAVGHSGEVTLATTNAFVKLAGDISSLYNIDYSEASSKIRSVLQGQSRAGYGFGWDTTMASLQATADELNLSKAVSEMSQMEKQQLRILTILNQSRVAYGDQSNTINTLANQLRLLKNNIKEASMVLGQLFVPILSKLIPVINGTTIAIKRLMGNLASIFGIKIEDTGQGFTDMEDDAENLEDTYDDLAESIKAAKNQLLGFDEVNKLQEPTSVTGIDGDSIDLTDEILTATKEYEEIWQEAFDKMEANSNKWADKIEKALSGIGDVFEDFTLGDFFKAGEDTSQLVIDINNFIATAIKNVDWKGLGENVGLFLRGIKWTEIIISLSDVISSAFNGLWDAWIAMMKESPIETALLTAIALLKIDPIRNALASKLATVGGTASSPIKISTYLTVAVIGIQIAKNLGEMIGEALVGDFDPWVYINADNEQAEKIQGITDKYEALNSKVAKYIELSKDYANLSAEDKGYVKQMGEELKNAGIVEGIKDITGAWEGTNAELVKAIQNQALLAKINSSQKYVDELRGQLEEKERERAELNAEYADLGVLGLVLTPWKEVGLSNALKDNEKDIDTLRNSIAGAEQVVVKLENDFNELNDIIPKIIGNSDLIDDAFNPKTTEKKSLWARLTDDIKAYNKTFNKYNKSNSKLPLTSKVGSKLATGLTSLTTGVGTIMPEVLTDDAIAELNKLVFGYEDTEEKIEKNPLKPSINNARYINGLDGMQTLFDGVVLNVNNANIEPNVNTAGAISKILGIKAEYNTNKDTIESNGINPSLTNTKAIGGITEILNKFTSSKSDIEKEEINPVLTGSKVLDAIKGITNQYTSRKNSIEESKITPNMDTDNITNSANAILKAYNNTIGKFATIVSVEEDTKSITDMGKSIASKLSDLKIVMEMKNVGQQIMATFMSMAPGFATGGFPEDGLFFANHNELVGQFSNGRTAVANNEQITQGIAQAVAPAVYDAVVSAMQNTQRGSSDVVVNIDGKQVFKAVQRQANDYTAQTGLSPFNI